MMPGRDSLTNRCIALYGQIALHCGDDSNAEAT